jgi:hypothetical protein
MLTLLEHLSSPPAFSGVRVTRSLVLCVSFADRCLSFCTFSFWSLCCLFFFNIRILITPLVSSKSSWQDYKIKQTETSLSYFEHLIVQTDMSESNYMIYCFIPDIVHIVGCPTKDFCEFALTELHTPVWYIVEMRRTSRIEIFLNWGQRSRSKNWN